MAVLGGLSTAGTSKPEIERPPAEDVLIGAPDIDGPTSRQVFLRDPAGQVDRIAAGDHLVAWTVRTPADGTRPGGDEPDPVVFPNATKVVVVDERSLARVTLDYPGRWVDAMRFVHGPSGLDDTQLAVHSCSSRKTASCTSELISISSGRTVAVARRSQGPDADGALRGQYDGGKRLLAGEHPPRGACVPRLSVEDATTGDVRHLPALPADGGFPKCTGLSRLMLDGHYAFAWIDGDEPKFGWSRTVVFGLDLLGGSRARWRGVQTPYRYTDGSTGYAIGPAVGRDDLVWEELDDDQRSYSLSRVELPRDVRQDIEVGTTPTQSDSVAPSVDDVCDLVSSGDAIYELANPRCAALGSVGSAGAVIRRVVNPVWAAEPTG